MEPNGPKLMSKMSPNGLKFGAIYAQMESHISREPLAPMGPGQMDPNEAWPKWDQMGPGYILPKTNITPLSEHPDASWTDS